MFLYCIITILVLIYYLITKKYDYFTKKKIPHLKPTFLFGNYGDLILRKKSQGEVVQEICKQFPDEQIIGAYFATEPVLIPTDPDFIKLIVTKNFPHFTGKNLAQRKYTEPGNLNLFTLNGDTWKVLRQNITTLFSSAKLRNMFNLIQKCSYEFESMIDKEVSAGNELEIRIPATKYSIECITTCAFGVSVNAMTDDPKSKVFLDITDIAAKFTPYIHFKIIIGGIWPRIFYGSGLTIFSTYILDFINNLMTSAMKIRHGKSSGRYDLIDFINDWKQNNQIVGDSIKDIKTHETQRVTLSASDDILAAQGMLFYFAGSIGPSITTSQTLFELAKYPEIQDKVLEEVDYYMTSRENKLLYDCITEMPYLEACADEALRMYPPVAVIIRQQTEPYTFPNGIHIEEGMRIQIPVSYLHYNPKYFPNPEEFRPERFLGEEKKKIKPYTYMPFGEGPRACPGFRLAKMQIMTGLITILKKYRVELADGMPRKIKLCPIILGTHPAEEIRLKFIKREDGQERMYDQNQS